MWLLVALDQDSVQKTEFFTKVCGPHYEQYYFDRSVAEALEKDGFLKEMWEKLDALFDWGKHDFFPAEKCRPFRDWLEARLKRPASPELETIYRVMLDYAEKAIEKDTGISFDF